MAVGLNVPVEKHSFAFPDSAKGLSFNNFDAPTIFIPQFAYLKYEFKVDSTKNYVVGSNNLVDPYFAKPVIFSLEDYKNLRYRSDIRATFKKAYTDDLFESADETGDGALKIEIPWRVKSKTFRKIFGGDRVGLRVTGNITIDGGLRRQKTDQVYTTQNDQNNYSFRIDQTQRFTIEGRVGDKVSVHVDQDSERMFDFENSLKLEYTGEEDEIIQKIEAGNVSLSLTGTSLATFSGKNTGLFGLKTESRFGPLKLTTIASVEKGQKNKKSLTGGAEETSIEIQATNIVKGKYFFLSEEFRNNYRYFDNSMNHLGIGDPIQDIEVYKKVNLSPQNQNLVRGWGMNSPTPNSVPPDSAQDKNNILGYWKQLTKSIDYTYNPNLGYIRLNYGMSDDEALAVAYITTSSVQVGDYILPPPGDSTLVVFKLLRANNPQPSDSTWDLQFRNVYSLQASNIQKEGFEFKVFNNTGQAGTDAETQEVEGEQVPYIQILGLDDRNESGSQSPDGILDDNPAIINWATGELILPGLRPFDPDPNKPDAGYFINGQLVLSPLDDETWIPSIYDTTWVPPVSKYYFSVKHRSASASYNLGFNVLEGSEEVFLNGARLKKGSDYTIDYLTGNLIILNEAASSSSAQVEVLWESGEIFQLDKKTMLGVRGEYELWNDESFIGTTALFLNEKPLEERVKVGNEPTRNFVLDGNSRMVFDTGLLTNLLDMLPFIEADQPSQISVEGEIARVYPNPNSLNNKATGDYNGVAYLDDFESIKRTTSLGIMRKNWKLGSVPDGAVPGFVPDSLKNLMRGDLDWYNPYDQVHVNHIWPEREVNSQVASEVHVLSLDFKPIADTLGYTNQDVTDSWASVQRYLSAGYADQSKSKYLEVWIKNNGAPNIELNVDLGLVSEDAIPNDTLNTEDIPLENLPYGDNILQDAEDVGLDMMGNNDERASIAGGDYWDLNRNGIKEDYEPFSHDLFKYDASNKNNYTQINGTEGNKFDEGERIPDTEDLNSNGVLDQTEQLFRCTLPIPPPDSLLASPPNEYGWMQIRFPLKYAEQINNPNWTQIEYVRLWLNESIDTTQVQIASIELVGNEWEEVVDTTIAGPVQERLEVSVVNTYDNAEYVGNQPPGVRGERDPITNLLAREQSLTLKVIDLPPRANAMAQRTFFNSISFLEYDSLKMFVRGGGFDTGNFEDYDLNMMFRFGADTSSNYYEIYQDLQPGWDSENEIKLSLEEIPTIKLERDALNSGIIDTSQTATRISPTDSTVGYRIVNGDSIVIKGNPSLSQVRQLTLGVHNPSKEHYTTLDELEIWVDELRLSSVKKDPGTAYRASADIQLSDLGNIHLAMSEQDPDFHSLEQRLGSGNGTSDKSISGNFSLDRFLPPTWGVRVPFNGNYSTSTSVPKYYPGSDILLDESDKAAVDTVKNYEERSGWGVSFSKTTKSTNPLLKYTIDNVSCGYDYSDFDGSSTYNVYSKSYNHTADFSYGLSFGREFAFNLFSWTKSIPLLKKLKDTELAYLPSRLQTSINANENVSESLSRTGVQTQSRIFGVTRTFSTGYRPFSVMSFDLNRTHRSDMQMKSWSELFGGDFGRDNNVTQSFNGSYSPVIFKWLNHDFNYNSNYQWSWSSGFAESGQSISSNRTASTSWTLKMSQLFPKKSKAGRGSRAKRGGRGKPGKDAGNETETKDKKDEEKKKSINFLSPLQFMTSRINDIRFDYSRNTNLSTPAVQGQAGWKYQLGFSEDPEIGQVAGYSASTPSKSYTDDYKIKSGLNIISNLKTTFDYAFSNTESFGTTNSGNYSETTFYTLSKDGEMSSIPFVNLSLRLTGLEKLAIFQNVAQTVSLESAFNGKAKTDWTIDPDSVNTVTYDRNLSPLIGFNISWKGGISTNFSIKRTQSLSDKIKLNQKNKTDNTTISLTANYTRRSGFRIPIPVWPFKNKRFENNTTFSLTFSSSVRTEALMSSESTKFSTTTETKQWSIKPMVDYTFSSTVTGGVFFETGATENSLTGKTSFHEFGFNVNISIRGR